LYAQPTEHQPLFQRDLMVVHFPIFDYTLFTVILGTSLLGMTAGSLGVFALLRRQSLLGDTISHACLPGIALAFLYTHSKNPGVLMIGAMGAGALSVTIITYVTKKTSIKHDAILGIVLSVFFGLGLMLLTFIQKNEIPHQSILNKFIFGSAATLLAEDIYTMIIVSLLVLVTLFTLWKEFKVVTFNPSHARIIGYPVNILQALLTTLLLIIIVTGLQTVGVILMSSMIIAPAATAMLWTNRLEKAVVTSALCGGCASMLGSLVSSMVEHLPTGPTIVLISSAMIFSSLLYTTKQHDSTWNLS
jgi:manganese/zinc/iron transport system permease protein